MECSELFSRNAAFSEGAKQRTFGAADIGGPSGTLGQGRKFTQKIVVARGARAEGAVLKAAAFKIGVGDGTAAAAIGKGEATEGGIRRVDTFAGHTASIAQFKIPTSNYSGGDKGIAGMDSRTTWRSACNPRTCSWGSSKDGGVCLFCRAPHGE